MSMQVAAISAAVSSFVHFVNCNAHQKVKITAVQPSGSGSSAIVLIGAETVTLNRCFSPPRDKPLLTKGAGLAGAHKANSGS